VVDPGFYTTRRDVNHRGAKKSPPNRLPVRLTESKIASRLNPEWTTNSRDARVAANTLSPRVRDLADCRAVAFVGFESTEHAIDPLVDSCLASDNKVLWRGCTGITGACPTLWPPIARPHSARFASKPLRFDASPRSSVSLLHAYVMTAR
jgi:hypothetical protein